MSAKFVPTNNQRYEVRIHAIAGTPQVVIAKLIKNSATGKPISKMTLRRAFKEELDTGLASIVAKAVGVIAKRLQDNDLGAACFVLKTRAGWTERPDPVDFDEEKLAAKIVELTQAARPNV